MLKYGIIVKQKLSTLFWVGLLVMFSGCFRDFRDIDGIKSYKWEPTVALPLINSTFSFKDFVSETGDSTSIIVGDDQVLTFVYEDQIISKTGESIYLIEDQDFQLSKVFPNSGINQYNIRNSIEITETVEFDFVTGAGQEIDSVFLKDGLLDIDLNWNFNQPGEFEITFLSLEENGQPLTLSQQFFGNVSYQESISLAGLKADLTDDGKAINKFLAEIRFLILNDGNPLPPSPGYDLSLILFAPKFQAIYGELGSIPFSTNKGLTELTFFENFQFGSIRLEDPSAIVNFTNSFGLGAQTYLDKFVVKYNGGESFLEGEITTDPIILNGVPLANIGQTTSSSVEVNNQNSNLSDLIENIPTGIELEFNGVVENPDSRDYLLDTSKITMDLFVELPFHGSANGLEFTHDFEVDGSVFEDLNNALIRFYTLNELPIGLTIQGSFLNASGFELFEVFGTENNIIMASQNDLDGNVINPGESEVFVELDQTQLEIASRAEFFRITIEVSTFDNGTVPVKILESQKILFSVGVQSKYVNDD